VNLKSKPGYSRSKEGEAMAFGRWVLKNARKIVEKNLSFWLYNGEKFDTFTLYKKFKEIDGV